MRHYFAKGSYTVEATFVMSIALMLMTALIFLDFCLHDRLVAWEIGQHYLERLSWMTAEPVSEEGLLEIDRLKERNILRTGSYRKSIDVEETEEAFIREVNSRTFIMDMKQAEFKVDDREAKLSYSGTFRFEQGGMTSGLLSSFLDVEVTMKKERTMDPEEFVRFCRGLIWR